MAKVSVTNLVTAVVLKKRKRKHKLNKIKSKTKIIEVKPSITSDAKPPIDTSNVVTNLVTAVVLKKRKRKPKLNKNKSETKIIEVKPSITSDAKLPIDTSNVVTNLVTAVVLKKRKRKPKLNKNKSETKIIEVKPSITSDAKPPIDTSNVETNVENDNKVPSENKKVPPTLSTEQFAERFPIFKDKELIKKFLGVTMNNNQKGRIRQTLKDSLIGTSEQLLPDVIHNRVQAIVKETPNLTDAELRKIRILYNMLKTAVETQATAAKVKKNKKKNKKKNDKANKSETEVKSETEMKSETEVKSEITDEEMNDSKDIVEKHEGGDKEAKVKKNKQDKTKGPKRYVVFVGNLPLDIDKDRIIQHFKDFKDYIVDVRIPKQGPNKKTSIAYVELKNELCYELALSKHHTMLDNKRINVHYTRQKNSKISKTEAKGKAAKLVALQKSGKLAGSIPLNRKRSQRRLKAKQAKARLEAQA